MTRSAKSATDWLRHDVLLDERRRSGAAANGAR